MRYFLKSGALSLSTLIVLCLSTSFASAACTTPAGNPGDVVFSSLSGQMAYCNGTSWIGMGVSQPIGFGTLTTGDFCTATSGTQISCTTATISLSSQVSGSLQAAQFPALTGDVTTTAGSLATTIGTNKVTMGDIAQIAGLSVIGNSGATTANVAAITGTANQVLVVNSGATGLVFGALNLASGAAVTGTLGPTNGGTGQAAYATGDILYASAANTLSRLAAGTNGNVLTLTGGVPTWAASTGGVTSFSAGTTGLTPNSATTGAIVLAGTLGVASGGTGAVTLAQNGLLLGNGTGSVGATAVGATGTVLIGNSGAAPSFSTSPSLTNLTLSGVETITFAADWTTTGTQTDVAVNTSSAIRYNGASAATFFGIVAGTPGQILYLHNASTGTLTLSNQSASDATAANRIITGTGADMVMASNSSATLQYDGSAGRWRVIGGSGGSGGSGGTVWELIQSTDIATAATSFTFSGLSGDTDGEYMVVARIVGNGSFDYGIYPNGDTTAANYGLQNTDSLGSSTFASSGTSSGMFIAVTNAAGQLSYGTAILYAKSGFVRTYTATIAGALSGASASSALFSTGTWNNTASVITSLLVQANNGSSVVANGLGVGTHLELWAQRSVGGSGGSATPGGANTNVQFNSGGTALGGDSGFTYGAGTATLGTSLTAPLVVGGTGAASALTLQSTSGSGTSDSIAFKTGNNGATTAMTINTAGNVGIGTTSPGAALDVNGAIDIKGQNGISFPSSDSTAGGSIAIGSQALQHQSALASAAFRNTAVGYQAMSSASMTTAATANTALGFEALQGNTTGAVNTAVGDQALLVNTTGGNNVAVGVSALLANTIGGHNVAIGNDALQNNISGTDNTVIGPSAGRFLTSGSDNTLIGGGAGQTLTTGGGNIVIGVGAINNVDTPAANTSNFLNIGNVIFATGMTGSVASPAGNVGIGTTSPAAALDVNGAIDIKGQNGISFPSSDSTAGGSIAIGSQALSHESALASTAFQNTAVGYQAIGSSGLTTSATFNTALGFEALQGNTSGTGNTAVGAQALRFNTTGNSNVAIGFNALPNATGAQNVAVGAEALASANGGNNVAIGFAALLSDLGGSNNVAIGNTTLGFNSTGNSNVAIGNFVASTGGLTGSNNILIGTNNAVSTPATTTSNFLNIGNLIYGTSIGTAASPGNVGIGTAAPTQPLHVWGNIDSGNAGGYLTEVANAGTTGTTVNKLAKLTGAPATAVVAATTDTDGMLGIVAGGAGTSGNAQIATAGQASCVFDGATTAGDYVGISSTTAGDCTDAGASRPSGQTIGRVLTSNASAGTYAVTISLGGGSGGGTIAPTGTVWLTIASSPPSGWLMFDDGTFGSASSGSSNSNSVANQALFNILFAAPFTDATAPMLTSTGSATTRAAQGTAAAAWAANCRMSLPKTLGRALAIAGSGSGLTARTMGQTVGTETDTLATANLPPYTPAGSVTSTVNQSVTGNSNQLAGNGSFSSAFINSAIVPTVTSTFTGTAQGGTSTPFSNMQPTSFLNAFVKQ